MRYETVYDNKYTDLGPQGSVPGKPIIIVDGVPYVNRMPESYVMISLWHAKGVEDPATGKPYTLEKREEIHAAREVYQMIPKGKIDADGHQRFTYPDPRTYVGFDPATGKITKDNPAGSVTLGLEKDVIKHLQKFPWKSEDWFRAYGQRNQVEMSNMLLKLPGSTNLAQQVVRTGRGYAYNYFAAMIASVATNIRRIIQGIIKLNATDSDGQPKHRVRKRRDTRGCRLNRTTETHMLSGAESAPPEVATE